MRTKGSIPLSENFNTYLCLKTFQLTQQKIQHSPFDVKNMQNNVAAWPFNSLLLEIYIQQLIA